MRWMIVALIVVAACSQKVPKKPYRPAPPMAVEDVASWFMRAALSGDEPTARTLTMRYDHIAQISDKVNADEWETAVKDVLDQLAREGDGETFVVKAEVVERRTLKPGEKRLREVDVAVVRFTVNDRASPFPFFFFKTDEGWKFSPKK